MKNNLALTPPMGWNSWNGRTFELGGHDWNLFPEEARETFISPSNNDCGTVRSPFLLEDLHDVVIDGQGARLLVRGTPQAGRGRVGIIENITAYPQITLRNNIFRWNRARGILINGNPPIRVENNQFENPGCAIMIESSPFWAESGPVSDVRISGNTFTHCATCPSWGRPLSMPFLNSVKAKTYPMKCPHSTEN